MSGGRHGRLSHKTNYSARSDRDHRKTPARGVANSSLSLEGEGQGGVRVRVRLRAFPTPLESHSALPHPIPLPLGEGAFFAAWWHNASSIRFPSFGPRQRSIPTGGKRFAVRARHSGSEPAIDLPLRRKF